MRRFVFVLSSLQHLKCRWKFSAALLCMCLSFSACGSAHLGLAQADSADSLNQQTCVAPANANAVPTSLQSTGCFSAAAEPAANLFAYEVNSPLFADGAGKRRWLYLPKGTTAHFDPNNVLSLPLGSMVFKEFALGSVRLETRMLWIDSNGVWRGLTYRWNDAQDTATLLADGLTDTTLGVSWTYPSRAQCVQCHQANAGTLLGVRSEQLNRLGSGSNAEINQLTALVTAGLIGSVPENAGLWPDPLGTADVASRAKSYLAANCAFCHMPNGSTATSTDYRFATPLADMGICNVATTGPAATYGATILVPSSPQTSVLSVRMHSTVGGARMPPVGRTEEDTNGVGVIDAWIAGLTSCPSDPGLDPNAVTP